MDPHVRWLRRRIVLSLPRSIGGVFGLGSTLCFLGLDFFTDGSLLSLIPWSLLAGQVVAGVGMAWALATNPLSFRYLHGHTSKARSLRAVEPGQIDPELVNQFGRQKLTPLATIWDHTADPVPASDLFQTPRQTVTLACSRATGSVALFSRLDDGRILLTDSIMTVPHRKLIVNLAAGDDTNSLVTSHREAIDKLKDRGHGVRADDGSLVLEAMVVEHQAYCDLGAAIGTFFNLTPEPAPLRFLMTLERTELMRLALETSDTGRSEPTLVG